MNVSEVFKALNKIRGLYLRWQEVVKYPTTPVSPEVDWITTELRNAIRSIEWDLEDLEDTISIVESKTSKFKIDNKESNIRRTFIEATRQEINTIKNKMHLNRNREGDGTARQPLLGDESPPPFGPPMWSSSKYSKLASTDSPQRFSGGYDSDIQTMQERMLTNQNEQLEVISKTVGNLNAVSRQIGLELDEHTVMLDDLNADLENADSKLDTTIKKVAKVLHMNNDRRQWWAIGVLIAILIIVILLFIMI